MIQNDDRWKSQFNLAKNVKLARSFALMKGQRFLWQYNCQCIQNSFGSLLKEKYLRVLSSTSKQSTKITLWSSFKRASFIVIAQVSLLSRFRKKRYKSWAKLAWDCQWGAIIRILWSLRRVGGVRYIWLWLKQNPSFFQPFPTGRLA